MADNVAQVYAGTLAYSNFDSNGEASILTTDSATRYVLKDVAVETKYAGPKLLVNGHNVATLNSNVSGSEIVDVNSSVKVALPYSKATDGGSLNLEYTNGSYAGSYFVKATTNIAITKNAPINSVAVIPANYSNINMTNNPPYYNTVIYNNGSSYLSWQAYTDGNSTSTLIRNGSGYISDSYAIFAYDGDGGYYYLSSNNYIRRYNIATEASSNRLYVGYAGSTYPSAGFCNGMFFYNRYYSSGVINIYNTYTNALYSVSADASGISNNINCYVTYDPVNYVYYYWLKAANFNTNAWVFKIQSNSTNSSFTLASPTPTVVNLSEQFYWGYSNFCQFNGYAIITDTNSRIWLMDYYMNKIAVLNTSTSNTYGIITRHPNLNSTTIADSEMPTIKVRVTGVKST